MRGAISTHAPRTGSDACALFSLVEVDDFNPRSPHGERRFQIKRRVRPGDFNPRSPHGERRQDLRDHGGAADISTHAPRTGSDLRYPAHVHDLTGISTHAPRTGSDGALWRWREWREFQPTLPARGATTSRLSLFSALVFQPTLPARGATRPGFRGAEGVRHFNPRSPHGERRQRKVTILSIRIIGFAQKVYHKTVLLRISLAENAVILPEKPRNPVRTSLQKAGGLRFARAIRAARPYSISSPSGA